MIFKVLNPNTKESNYWGFIDSVFVSPPVGTSMPIKYCLENSKRFVKKDKFSYFIFEGDLFSFARMVTLETKEILKGKFVFNKDELRFDIEILDHDGLDRLEYCGNGILFDFEKI